MKFTELITDLSELLIPGKVTAFQSELCNNVTAKNEQKHNKHLNLSNPGCHTSCDDARNAPSAACKLSGRYTQEKLT